MTLKESIIESATEVYNELGGGHLESVYHDAITYTLWDSNLA